MSSHSFRPRFRSFNRQTPMPPILDSDLNLSGSNIDKGSTGLQRQRSKSMDKDVSWNGSLFRARKTSAAASLPWKPRGRIGKLPQLEPSSMTASSPDFDDVCGDKIFEPNHGQRTEGVQKVEPFDFFDKKLFVPFTSDEEAAGGSTSTTKSRGRPDGRAHFQPHPKRSSLSLGSGSCS